MPKHLLPYSETGYFSQLICDYLDKNEATKAFYHRSPKLENFKLQIEEKASGFNAAKRKILKEQILQQYELMDTSEETNENILRLGLPQTFTITTGHQLNLFTGPLYFLYKIFSVIILCEELRTKYPDYHFVPVFWMATEDHDFEEINYFNLKGKKIVWDRDAGGAVGELNVDGLDEIASVLREEFGNSEQANDLSELFRKAYTQHSTLADATRYLGNELFKEHGLVIIDGNDLELKKLFIPYAERELRDQLARKTVQSTTKRLVEAGYSEQVHPREINLFYLQEGRRDRIVYDDGRFKVLDTDLSFSENEIMEALQDNPKAFSPNALLRPLYQEVILPNLCYVGGGGELAYWFQLKDYFQEVNVPFPILLLRNSVLLMTKKQAGKLEKLGVELNEIFLPQHDLTSQYTRQISSIKIDFTPQREHLQKQFEELYALAEKTDPSFLGAVGAQEKKQLNGLDKLEKRLLKAQKRMLADKIERLTDIQDTLFPSGNLQERNANFSEFYLEYGYDLLVWLKAEMEPLDQEFTVLVIDRKGLPKN